MNHQPTPRFAVVSDPAARCPQELASHARIDQALLVLTRARRGKWKQAQLVEVSPPGLQRPGQAGTNL